jgi:hypothetical protein
MDRDVEEDDEEVAAIYGGKWATGEVVAYEAKSKKIGSERISRADGRFKGSELIRELIKNEIS